MTLTAGASLASAQARSSRREYRDQVGTGEVTLRDLLICDTIPASVGTTRAFQVATWPFPSSLASGRNSPVRFWLQRLNFAAIQHAVNVFEEVGRLNMTQLEWLVSYVEANPAGRVKRKVAA